jgi:hypothetical protein
VGLARRSEKQFPYCPALLINKGVLKGQNMEDVALCQCGCGLPAPISTKTRREKNWVKGEPKKFINGHNARLLSSEEQKRRNSFRDFSRQRFTGSSSNYVKYRGRHMHRVVAELKLGRALLPGEIVHHIDGDKWNNDPDNLAVMTQAEHARIHCIERHHGRVGADD